MSLINEALKKSQAEQRGKDGPASGPLASSALKTGKSRSPVAAVVMAIILFAAGAAGFFLLNPDASSEAAQPVPPLAKKEPAPSSVIPAPQPAPVTPVTPVVQVSGPAPVADLQPVSDSPVKPPADSVPPTLKPVPPAPNPEIALMIEGVNVSLVRAKNGRCVLDGVVLKQGDALPGSPGVILHQITDTEIIFKAADGVEYPKKYK